MLLNSRLHGNRSPTIASRSEGLWRIAKLEKNRTEEPQALLLRMLTQIGPLDVG
jgi:hypothetical protein